VRFEWIVLTPPGLLDPALAAAASRSGALGILDLEWAADSEVDGGSADGGVPVAVAALDRLAHGPYGVKLDGGRPEFARRVIAILPAGATTVLLTPGADRPALEHLVALARGAGRRVLFEATSADEADAGLALGVDGLIAKGHEAAGRIGEETTFILLQRLAGGRLPVLAQGGLGLHSAAAVYAGGGAGCVLDAQLYLTRESPLPAAARRALARLDGSETALVEDQGGRRFRVLARPGARLVPPVPGLDGMAPVSASWPLGQDAAFAAPLAERGTTVAGVLQAMRASVASHLAGARKARALDRGGPLARSHGTDYPIVQGPMTRVSDTAPFAAAVAAAGGLPFLALALLRAAESRRLLEETKAILGQRPWGVGILGFVPLALRQEQMEAIRACPPTFALIAGGRPDQARALEADGIPTYLHVPSPGLLKLFVEQGARRFVFEGRECGGHVGPRTSFVLWNTMVDVLLSSLPAEELAACHVLFAAGIHDARSAAMVAALAAPLSEKGAKVGVLLGTAYLFTHEAVAAGAIVPGFQEAAVECSRTVLLETGPGHATRCVASPFAETFESERRRLLEAGAPAEEAREALEALNLGRLRLASKGVDRDPRHEQDPTVPRLRKVETGEQRREGMFMIGQVAALRDRTVTMAELHRDVAVGAVERLEALAAPEIEAAPQAIAPKPSDVAIVGMASLLPKAPDLATYWRNILDRVDAVTEVPEDRWDARLYFDAERTAKDKIYSKWGGFLDDVPFDPMRYGITPASLRSIEPVQLLLLDVVRAGLQDAGYLDRPFPRAKSSVILGAGGGISDLGSLYTMRSLLPSFLRNPPQALLDRLPEWTEDSFPGILLNVAAGRVANRFDLGGANFTVDAACASSLAAIYLAVRELETGSSDLVITGGIDTAQNPFMFLCFSKTHAHSPRGRCRTFDATADGIAISEGIAVLVLKRLADAERDGDRIYAVIKAVGASSDGRDRGLTAPRPEGQMLALERAYAKAGLSPATVGLVEAHGTGTVAGDQAEVTTLKTVFEAAGAPLQGCAIGSVKSLIGHTKCTAGVAGLQKVALALHHKVLPPTLHVETPNPKADFPSSPFYVNSETRPWIASPSGDPRRAAVSAFGFGGTNFHAVVEEYRDRIEAPPPLAATWPAEIFVFRGRSREEIVTEARRIEAALVAGAEPEPAALALALWRRAADRGEGPWLTLAIVAEACPALQARLRQACERLEADAERLQENGMQFATAPFARDGHVALLFPGQGSQSVDMLRDLALHFDEVRVVQEQFDKALAGRFDAPLSRHVFPPPAFTPDEKRARQAALTATEVAQPALGAADLGALRLLEALGLRASMAAGHSYGEYVALAAAGVIDAPTLAHLSERRGRAIKDAAKDGLGTMAAVSAAAAPVEAALAGLEEVWIANYNAPSQTVISGSDRGVALAIATLEKQGITARPLPVAAAFHSPIVAGARDRLVVELERATFRPATIPVFANTTAAPYPADPAAARDLLGGHLAKPVRFADQIEAMHQAGARLFVEVGPKNVLCGLTQQILADRPHVAVPLDVPGRHGVTQLLNALAVLLAHGVGLDLDRLFAGRVARPLDLARLVEETRPRPLPPTTWFVNGAYARPLREPKRTVEPIALEAMAPPVAPAVAPAVSSAPAVPPIPGAVPAAPVMSAMPAGADATAEMVVQFQRLMSQFLETQRAVMQSYLGGARLDHAAPPLAAMPTLAATQPALAAAPQPPTRVVSPAPTEAAPVVTAPTVATRAPADLSSAATPDPGIGRNAILEKLVGIAADRTGYPAEMIDIKADIEADLGIDSIKRVEILGALQRALPASLVPSLQAEMERLTRARSLGAMADRIAAAAPSSLAATPPSPAAATPATGTPAPPSHEDAADVLPRLVAIVADRTGYPAEMIDVNADIEADLGIDSIKRVEILGALQRVLPQTAATRLQGAMEKLTRARTLRAIADGASAESAAPGPAAPAATAPARPAPETSARPASVATAAPGNEAQAARAAKHQDAPLARFLLRAVEAAPDPPAAVSLQGARLLLIDDGGGVAEALAEILRARGAATFRVGPPAASGPGVSVTADLGDAQAVEALLEHVRASFGAPTGIVHLLPLRGPAGFDLIDLTTFKRRLALEVGGLFHLARAAATDIRAAGSAGLVVAATARGGRFGIDGETDCFPGGAGVAGFLKTLALEWPEARVKAIDLDRDEPPAALAARLLEEITGGDGEVEVGFVSGRRQVLRPVEAPLAVPAAPANAVAMDASAAGLGPGAVVLVTGGARGITAEAVVELARRHRPTFVLVGRSPAPAETEAAETARLTSPADLKAAVMASLRATAAASSGTASPAGGAVTPAAVDRALARLMGERDMRRTLEAVRAAGSQVRYLACDVRDPRAFGDLIDRVYAEQGRIDGVIHGAGLIEDRLVADKEPASFERVFGTKVDGAFILASRLRLDALRFFAAFTSVAGRFGNRGQSDYAAANETVAAMLQALDRATPARLTALHWGPWGTTGMASPEVQKQFAARGVELIDPPAGSRACCDEIARGRKGEIDVLLGDGPWRAYAVPAMPRNVAADSMPRSVTAASTPRAERALPLLGDQPLVAAPGGAVAIVRRLDPARDLYLGDHRLDGKPVFPAACAMELMAEVAARGWPDQEVIALEEFRVVKGIVLEAGPRDIKVTARAETQPDQEGLEVGVDVAIVDPANGRPFYRGTVRLGPRLPEPQPSPLPPLRAPRPFGKSVRGAYDDWLFHGPLFQGLTAIDEVGEEGIGGVIVPSDPARCLVAGEGAAGGRGAWLIDPVVVDSAFQLGILYARSQYDVTPLPARFTRYRRFAPLAGETIRCEFRSRAAAGPNVLIIQIALLDGRGQLLGLIEEMELSCSRELNRLAGRGASEPAR
jgi:acyl transferase domain-containing protein/NAD(P)H-dependent flavin oxidoreductase YrpB (nitropropane dioxygenase family)/NADP-dependent 3-hydroxy acid dehydrogenase YdfG